jgi:hypothetical protein
MSSAFFLPYWLVLATHRQQARVFQTDQMTLGACEAGTSLSRLCILAECRSGAVSQELAYEYARLITSLWTMYKAQRGAAPPRGKVTVVWGEWEATPHGGNGQTSRRRGGG